MIQAFRTAVARELRHAENAYFLLKGLVSHTYREQRTHEEQALPSEYFWELTAAFDKRMQECRQRIDELELYLAAARAPRHFSPKMLQDIIDNQHDFFVTVTAMLAGVHEAVDVLREDYVALRKRIDRTFKAQPFDEAARRRDERSLTNVADAKLKKKQIAAGGLAAWATPQQGQQPGQQPAAGGWGAATTGGAGAGTTGFGFGAGTTGTGTATGSGFSFGGGAAPTGAGGFNLGAGTTTTGAAANTGAGGFSFGGGGAATTGGGFSIGGATTGATAGAGTGGFSFGAGATTATTTGGTSTGSAFGASGYSDLK